MAEEYEDRLDEDRYESTGGRLVAWSVALLCVVGLIWFADTTYRWRFGRTQPQFPSVPPSHVENDRAWQTGDGDNIVFEHNVMTRPPSIDCGSESAVFVRPSDPAKTESTCPPRDGDMWFDITTRTMYHRANNKWEPIRP